MMTTCHFGASIYKSGKAYQWAVNTDHTINTNGKPITGEATTYEEAVAKAVLALSKLIQPLLPNPTVGG